TPRTKRSKRLCVMLTTARSLTWKWRKSAMSEREFKTDMDSYTVYAEYQPSSPDDPIPWAYYAVEGHGDHIRGGWAGTEDECYAYRPEKTREYEADAERELAGNQAAEDVQVGTYA